MSLTTQINEELKNAMKNKDEVALRALRAIKSAILLARTEKGGNDEITEEQELKLLQKLAKQRKESIEIYKGQNRSDLYEAEEQELAIIEKFLPAQMDESKVKEILGSLNITDLEQLAGSMSGGQRKRLSLAKVLIDISFGDRNNFLILDEPTNHLDMATVELLAEALTKYDGSIILVSHDRYFISKTANKIWEIEDEKIIEFKGPF